MTPIFPALPFAYQPLEDKPVRQPYCAVVTDVQSRRNFTDVGLDPFRQALQGKQQLMLLRIEARSPGRLLAEMKEQTDLISKLGEGPVIAGSQLVGRHRGIISYYDAF